MTSTRETILKSAARVFARTGYRAATMQVIAAEAGFTPPTLYAHFGTKRGLFDGLVENVTGELLQLFEREVPEGLSLAQLLELRVRHLLELAERERDVFVLFVLRPYDLPTVDEADHDEQHARLHQHWKHVFAGHPNELGDRSPREAALLVEGILYAWVKDWLQEGSAPLASQTRRLVELILRGAIGGAGDR